MAASEVSAQGPDVIFADFCSILSLGFHSLGLRFPRFASWFAKVIKIRTENRRALSLLLHKRKDTVTNTSCSSFHVDLWGGTSWISDCCPSLHRSWCITKEWTVQPFLSELTHDSEQICGSIECCIRFLSSRRPSCHTVWVSPSATTWHPALQPNRLPTGPCPLSSVARFGVSAITVQKINSHQETASITDRSCEIGEFHSGWPCARSRGEVSAPRTVPVGKLSASAAGGHMKCPCFCA